MGWTWYRAENYKEGHYTKSGKWIKRQVDRKKEVEKIWSESKKHEILKGAMVGSTYYGAIKYKETGEVFAVVYITKTDAKDYYNFGYKDMDETMHPFSYDCPISILKLLTETDNQNANEWRKKCYENHASKKAQKTDKNALKNLPYGSRIKFKACNDIEYIVEKCEPNHQFKTYYFMIRKKNGAIILNTYLPKKHIPQGYEVIRYGYESETKQSLA